MMAHLPIIHVMNTLSIGNSSKKKKSSKKEERWFKVISANFFFEKYHIYIHICDEKLFRYFNWHIFFLVHDQPPFWSTKINIMRLDKPFPDSHKSSMKKASTT